MGEVGRLPPSLATRPDRPHLHRPYARRRISRHRQDDRGHPPRRAACTRENRSAHPARQLLAAARRRHGEKAAGTGAGDERHRTAHYHGLVPRSRRADVSTGAWREAPNRFGYRFARTTVGSGGSGAAQGFLAPFPAVRMDERHRCVEHRLGRGIRFRPAHGAQEPARPESARTVVAGVRRGSNRAGGGAEFRFQLPVDGRAPALELPEPTLEN